MKILITGGAGFIGLHTAGALLAKGHAVRILDNFTEPVHLKGRPAHIPKEVESINGDVRNKADWERALHNIDAVYHIAAYQDYLPDFSKFFHVNCVGAALLYEVAIEKKHPLKKVILASSQAVYGEGKYACPRDGAVYYPDIRTKEQLNKGEWDHKCPKCGAILNPQVTDESRPNPQNQYAISKLSQELIALNLGKRYGIPTVALRYSIVQGPGQSFYNAYSGVCRIFSLAYFFNKSPVIYEDGRQLRDFVNIDDCVMANLLALEKKEADYQTFNVGGGKTYTVLEFAQIARKVFGKEMQPVISGEYRFGDTRHIISDISKLRSLGWEPKYSAQKSIEDYKSWLERQANIRDTLDDTTKKMRNLKVLCKIDKIKEAK